MTDQLALYLPADLPDLNWLMSYPEVTDVHVTERDGVSPKQYMLKFLSMQLVMNIMPANQVYEHLAGFSNYVTSLQLDGKSDSTSLVLERIAKTKTVIGCVIDPGLDANGFMGGLLTAIITKYQGLMFARDCVFGSDGTPLIQG